MWYDDKISKYNISRQSEISFKFSKPLLDNTSSTEQQYDFVQSIGIWKP